MSDNEDLLRTAAEQFLGKGEQEIEDTIIQVIWLCILHYIRTKKFILLAFLQTWKSKNDFLIRHWKAI